jgi:hypothetical protein
MLHQNLHNKVAFAIRLKVNENMDEDISAMKSFFNDAKGMR